MDWPGATQVAATIRRLERIDPGAHRRIKGLRLVTAFGTAAMLGMQPSIGNALTGSLAGGFALWASVSEGQSTRARSTRDLAALCASAALGAAGLALLAPLLAGIGRAGPELMLATGAFLAGYLRRFGVLGTGLGSQIYIGQLLAYGDGLGPADLPAIGIAGLVAALASIVPRLLSGPAEHPVSVAAPVAATEGRWLSTELVMGLQAAVAAIIIVALNEAVGLEESAWAITACVYVIANTSAGTLERVWRRLLGTAIGVPLGLACLPLAAHLPLLVWSAAALAMIVYAMALPERYDIACGAYAFTLIVTLAASGEHSIMLLASRAWETMIGGAFGLATALLLFPLKAPSPTAGSPAPESGQPGPG